MQGGDTHAPGRSTTGLMCCRRYAPADSPLYAFEAEAEQAGGVHGLRSIQFSPDRRQQSAARIAAAEKLDLRGGYKCRGTTEDAYDQR